MRKFIEVKQASVCPDINTIPGVYEWCGMIYFCQGSGLFPTSVPIGAIQFESGNSVSSGFSESLLLKAIAVAQRPELAERLA